MESGNFCRDPFAAAHVAVTTRLILDILAREDGAEAEEEARRAAWQLQVQDEAKSRVEDSHKVVSSVKP